MILIIMFLVECRNSECFEFKLQEQVLEYYVYLNFRWIGNVGKREINGNSCRILELSLLQHLHCKYNYLRIDSNCYYTLYILAPIPTSAFFSGTTQQI